MYYFKLKRLCAFFFISLISSLGYGQVFPDINLPTTSLKLFELLGHISEKNHIDFSISTQVDLNSEISLNQESVDLPTLFYFLAKEYSILFLWNGISGYSVIPTTLAPKTDIQVLVVDSLTNEAISGVTLFFPDQQLGGISDSLGKIKIKNIHSGFWLGEFRHLSYLQKKEIIPIQNNDVSILIYKLSETEIYLDDILVVNTFDRLETMGIKIPTLHPKWKSVHQITTYDSFSSYQFIPGIRKNLNEAAFSIRGGSPNETMITYDGLELNHPFHFQGFFSLQSIILTHDDDEEYIINNGLHVSEANKSSGAIHFKTKALTQKGFDIKIESNLMTQYGRYRATDENSSKDIRFRYSDLSYLYKNSYNSNNLTPTTWDFYSKYELIISPSQKISGHMLFGKDNLSVSKPNDIWIPTLNMENILFSTWFNHQWILNSNAFIESQYSIQRYEQQVHFKYFNSFESDNIDERLYITNRLKSKFLFTENNSTFSTGIQMSLFNSRFYYYEGRYNGDPNALVVNQLERTWPLFFINGWLDYETRKPNNWVFNGGLLLVKEKGFKDFFFDPRVSLKWTPLSFLGWHLSMGKYTQFDFNKMVDPTTNRFIIIQPDQSFQVYSDLSFYLSNEMVVVVGFYDKTYTHFSDEFNFDFKRRYHYISPDFYRSSNGRAFSKGWDFSIHQKLPDFQWMFSYGQNQSEMIFDEERIRRDWDNEATINLSLSFHLGNYWTADIFYQKQSGPLFTSQSNPALTPVNQPLSYSVIYGKRNDSRSDSFQNLQFKLSKQFFTRQTEWKFSLGAYNILNYEPTYFEHKLLKANQLVSYPINKILYIPRSFLAEISFHLK